MTKARADRAMAITEDVKNRADRLLRRLGAEPLSNKGGGDRLESSLKDIKTTAGMAQARAKDAFQYANEFDEKLSRIFRYEK